MSIFNSLANPATSPPATLIGGTFGGECARCFGSESTLVAHNAVFDISFLRYEFSRLGIGMNNGYLCTMKMSRRRFPMLPNHKLETAAKHILGGLPPEINRHRALDDAKLTAMVWLEMIKR